MEHGLTDKEITAVRFCEEVEDALLKFQNPMINGSIADIRNVLSEISETEFFDTPSANQTYPQIQPLPVKEILKRGFC